MAVISLGDEVGLSDFVIRNSGDIRRTKRDRGSHEVRQIGETGGDVSRIGIIRNDRLKHPRDLLGDAVRIYISAVDANKGSRIDAAGLDIVLGLFVRDREDVGECVSTRTSSKLSRSGARGLRFIEDLRVDGDGSIHVMYKLTEGVRKRLTTLAQVASAGL